jgi:hypothetical protein
MEGRKQEKRRERTGFLVPEREANKNEKKKKPSHDRKESFNNSFVCDY